MKAQKQQGFTIIEVVLVLAIAGLIFLVVFLAVPALQRSQRDTQRRQDVGRVVSAVQSYRTNNKGNIPSSGDWNSANFKDAYLTVNGESFGDPQTGDYTLTVAGSGSQAPAAAAILVHPGNVCSNSNSDATTTNAGARNVAFRIKLESGGIYCVNN